MTREEIMKLEAGRELDGIVAQRVMGWTMLKGSHCTGSPVTNKNGHLAGMYSRSCPRYSQNIEDAWQIVEKMREKKLFLAIGNDEGGYCVGFSGVMRPFQSFAESAPLAICRSALLCVMEK